MKTRLLGWRVPCMSKAYPSSLELVLDLRNIGWIGFGYKRGRVLLQRLLPIRDCLLQLAVPGFNLAQVVEYGWVARHTKRSFALWLSRRRVFIATSRPMVES